MSGVPTLCILDPKATSSVGLIGEVLILPDGAVASTNVAYQLVFEGEQTDNPVVFPPDTSLCGGPCTQKLLSWSDVRFNQVTQITVQNYVAAFFYWEVLRDTIRAELLTVQAQSQETEHNK